ncbi:hypothetical protein P8452_38615 [Trifolium repens]|nr:hypothetical protein P8452_38615 [Trifolium repens]
MGKQFLHAGRVGFNSHAFLVIKVPDTRFLRILSRSLFLSLVFVAFPFFCSFLKGLVVPRFDDDVFVTASSSGSINVEVLNSILHDLGDEGLLKKEDKALIMSPPFGFEGGVSLLNWNTEVDLVVHEFYDFVFTTSFEDAVSADRVLKINGVVAFPLSVDDSSDAGFRKQSNYKVVYLRRYDSIFVALRKIGLENSLVDNSPKRRLCQFATVAKINALKGLEDALLEPPRQDSDEANKNYLKINYLPELLGDSLEGYRRRVFIGVGLHDENKAAIEWFERNYPKKGTKFQMHSLQVAPEEPDVPQTDFSAWLSKHVREDEYVVMKAEANVVEEMMRKKTICLVDELFLQCDNEWWQTRRRKKSGRAYWECLALYGRLRDEGVAVHQWWG